MLSIERLILFKFPEKKTKIFNRRTNNIAIAFFFSFPLLFYSYLLIGTTIDVISSEYGSSKAKCMSDEKWDDFVTKMSIVDIVFTILIPIMLIIFVNFFISTSLRLKPQQTFVLRRSMQVRRIRIYQKSNRNLFCISFAYVILNLPLAIFKLKNFILFAISAEKSHNFVDDETNNSTLAAEAQAELEFNVEISHSRTNAELNAEIFQRIGTYLYSLNYSINFFLYVINVAEFRDLLWKYIKKII